MTAASPLNVIAPCELKNEAEYTPKYSRSDCYICKKRFGTIFRRKHHCRVCGEVVCANCTSIKAVSDCASKQQVKVCFWCPQRTRTASLGVLSRHHKASPQSQERDVPSRRMTVGGEQKLAEKFWHSSRSE